MVEEYSNEYGEEEQEEAIENQVETSVEAQQDMMEDMSPSAASKEDLYSLFWKVINIKDSSKVGNLDKTELGLFDISVRDLQKIALIGNQFGHPGFAKFFAKQAEIVLATSSSKAGWLPELFVSHKKFQQKSRGVSNLPSLQPQPQKKKGLFSR